MGRSGAGPYWRVPCSARLQIRCEARARLSSGHSPAVGLSRSFFKIALTKCQKNYLELMEFEASLENLRWVTEGVQARLPFLHFQTSLFFFINKVLCERM